MEVRTYLEQVIKKRLQQVMDASVAKGETPGCILMVMQRRRGAGLSGERICGYRSEKAGFPR